MRQKIQKFLLENKYRGLITICALGVCLFFLSKLIFTSEKNVRKEVLKPLVHTETAYRRPMHKTISLFGKTVSDAQIDIVNKYAGKIEQINVELGSIVNKDDVLLVQELQDIDAELLKAQARYKEADATASKTDTEYSADYYKYKADYELAQLNFERYKKLHEMGAVSKLEYDKFKQVMVNAQAAYESLAEQKLYEGVPASLYAKEQVAQRRYQEFILLQNKKDDMILKAPRAGMISYRNAEVGAYAQAGTKLLTITDNSSFYIDCSISEYDAAVLAVGNNIIATIDALGKSLPGEIIFVSPNKVENNKNYNVRIKLLEEDKKIKAGMFARSELKFLQKDAAIYVNKDIVVDRNGKKYVFVINDDNKLEQREVKLGLRNDSEIEIVSGLTEGETVAVDNLSRLRQGLEIKIENDKGDNV
ncbi:efflux RND transporter periplasmic adaptor subunit [uncultured Phascolarctobacterium sp.]|uniref:efflux RND transporter periplasmic adaptor subunit n=1 Tax=Phascolarctobacterium sp. TaxID=2049039 RepID=UPI0025E95343|nr:efflux RND transporter periplasmic adaptor subunit [uncultured Phascolarctobacterium sp.]